MSELSVVAAPSTESLRRLVNCSHDGIVVLDRRAVVLLANPAAERMLRRARGALVGGEFDGPVEDLAQIVLSAPRTVLEMRVSRLDWQGRPARLVVLRDVTARPAGGRDSDRRMALLNDAERVAGLASWEMDIATGEVMPSPGLYRLLGHAGDEPTLHRGVLLDAVHPDDRGRVAETLEYVQRTGRLRDIEFRMLRAGGQVRIVHSVIAIAERHADGLPSRLRAMAQDVTGKRRAQRARRETFRLLDAVAENTVAAVAVKDLRGRFLFGNSRLAELLGRSRERLLGMTLHDLLQVEIADRLRAIDLEVLEGGVAITREQCFERADGTTVSWLLVEFPIRDEAGRPFAVGLVAVDFTEQRRAVEALRASEERFRLLAENAQDVIFLLHLRPEPMLEYISPATETVLGIPCGSVNDADTVRTLFDPAEVRALEEDFRSADPEPRVFPFRRPDGSEIWIERRGIAIRDESGRVVAVEGTLRDVTDRVTAEQERQRLARQLAHTERLDALGRLAGGVAHDFNNLLAVILGNAEFLADDFDQDDPRCSDIERIAQAAQRGAALTRQLLIFSRREPSRPEVLDVNQVIDGTEDMLRRAIGADLELVAGLSPGLPAISIDRAEFEQVLINLALNARAAVTGRGRLTIETSDVQITDGRQAPPALAGDFPVPAGRYVRVTVADTGCGMPPDVAGRAFEAFYTTCERGEGSGLGLTTAYGTIKAAGGSMTLESRPEEGTTVRIYLPVSEAGADSSAAALGALPTARGETVLVVEDEDPVRDVVTRVLDRAGYHVLAARSALDALRICADPETTIDALLTDVIMPGMTGGELAARLQETDRAGLPVLFMSGYIAGQRPIDPALKPGAAVLHKPFDADTLLHRIRATIGSAEDAD